MNHRLVRVLAPGALSLLLGSSAAAAQQAPPPSPPPGQAESLAGRVIGIFGKAVHPTLATVAPGGSLTVGVGFSPKPWRQGRLFTTARASISVRHYWITETNTWWQQANTFRLEGYARARSMPQLDFYGLGADSVRDDHSDFRFLDRSFGATGWIRPRPWVAMGGRVERLWPGIGSGTQGDLPSLEDRFDAAMIPGFVAQPRFVRTQVFVNLNYPAGRNERPRQGGDYQVAYSVFHASADAAQSFRRLELEGQQRFLVFGRDRKITLHAFLSTSLISGGNAVPFYLMQTLGGSGNLSAFREQLIGGDETTATLRGFSDYRFRDANLLLLQAEYRFKVWGPVDATVFADNGTVAPHPDDLWHSPFHHDFGGSVSLMRSHTTVVRLDVGFGGGEGVHYYFGLGHAFSF